LLAGFSLARRATFLDDRRFFFLSICTRGWCRRARLSSARGGLSRMVLSARCGCRRAHLTPPIAPCAHLHGAETLGGMQQHSRKESPGLPSSLVGCKCVPNLGRVRFFAVPCPARTRASPAPRNAFLLIHPCVRMVCNAFCAGAAMQGWVAGGSSGVGVCFIDSVFCPLLTPTARPPTSAAGHCICADWRDHGGWRGAATGERRRGVLGT
jgi:hypothetical protein